MAVSGLGQIKKENLAALSVIAVALIIVVSYQLILSPLLFKVRDIAGQLAQRKRDVQTAQISPEALAKLEQEIAQVKEGMRYYHKRLQTEAGIPEMLKELNQIAGDLNIKFAGVKPKDAQRISLSADAGVLVQIPIAVELKCGYHQLGQFINRIESSSTRFMKVTELKVSSNTQDIWVHNVELVITTYILEGGNIDQG